MDRPLPRRAPRNSSIELLRIVSMLMVIGFHFVYGNLEADAVREMPIGISKFIYQNLFLNGGWVGNCIFFTISVWFLADQELTLKSCLRRVWVLEREILFWSLVLLVASVATGSAKSYGIDVPRFAFRSFLPLSTALWWYPTSYAIFLVLMPFLCEGLRKIGRKHHGYLALICLLLWGFGGLVNGVQFDLNTASVFVFIYWFVLITYYKWYMRSFSTKQCWSLIGIGFGIEFLYWFGSNMLFQYAGRSDDLQSFIYDHWKLPTTMIGFGLFLLAERFPFHSRFVNQIAGTTFGIYLIHYHPVVVNWWTSPFSLSHIVQHPHGIGVVMILAIVFAVFAVCSILDLCRQLLFRITIDRRRGHLFDMLWSHRFALRSAKGKTLLVMVLVFVIVVSFVTVS